jgi:phosphoribosylformylglycinamidine synthase
MCFAINNLGASIDLSTFEEKDLIKILFAENIGIIFQVKNDDEIEKTLKANNINFHKLGKVTNEATLDFGHLTLDIPKYRDIWYSTSYLLDQKQSKNGMAKERFENFDKQPLQFSFPKHFTGKLSSPFGGGREGAPKAAIIREKGSNSEREMANAMYLAGFDVKDIHMTDLISGRENLEDVQFIGAVGGFSNSDVYLDFFPPTIITASYASFQYTQVTESPQTTFINLLSAFLFCIFKLNLNLF